MLNSGFDAFVSKLDPTGKTLLYSTFLGGACPVARASRASREQLRVSPIIRFSLRQHRHCDCSRSSWKRLRRGWNELKSVSSDSPTDFSYRFCLAKLNPGGSALVYATYLGGSGAETASSLALDSSGHPDGFRRDHQHRLSDNARRAGCFNQAQFHTSPGRAKRQWNSP